MKEQTILENRMKREKILEEILDIPVICIFTVIFSSENIELQMKNFVLGKNVSEPGILYTKISGNIYFFDISRIFKEYIKKGTITMNNFYISKSQLSEMKELHHHIELCHYRNISNGVLKLNVNYCFLEKSISIYDYTSKVDSNVANIVKTGGYFGYDKINDKSTLLFLDEYFDKSIYFNKKENNNDGTSNKSNTDKNYNEDKSKTDCQTQVKRKKNLLFFSEAFKWMKQCDKFSDFIEENFNGGEIDYNMIKYVTSYVNSTCEEILKSYEKKI